jgi:hypothetical protein
MRNARPASTFTGPVAFSSSDQALVEGMMPYWRSTSSVKSSWSEGNLATEPTAAKEFSYGILLV